MILKSTQLIGIGSPSANFESRYVFHSTQTFSLKCTYRHLLPHSSLLVAAASPGGVNGIETIFMK